MILASAAALLAAELLVNPADIPMTVTVELRVLDQPVVLGGNFEIEGIVVNPTDTPVSGCIGSARLFRIEGAKETERIPFSDKETGRCRQRGGFSLEPGKKFRWTETLPAGTALGEGSGRILGSFAVYQWRRRLDDGRKRDIRWEISREASFTAAAPPPKP